MLERVLTPELTVPRLLVEQAERLGDKAYVRYDADTLTYAGLVRTSEAASSRLARDFGFVPGTAAAIFLPNGRPFMLSWFASLFAGMIDVPISHEFKKAGLLFGLKNSEAKVIFTDADGIAALLDAEVFDQLNAFELIVATDDTDLDELNRNLQSLVAPPRTVSLAELISEGPHLRIWHEVPGTAIASTRYTSGTTGLPKGIMHSHLHMLSKAKTHNEMMGYQEHDLIYSPFPLHHSMSSNNGAMGTLLAGGSMVGVKRFSASNYWSGIREAGATLAHILDPLVPLLLKQPPDSRDSDHACRLLWAAWPNGQFEERFGTTILRIYALAEIGLISARKQKSADGSRATGPVRPEMEVRVVDENDTALDAPARGEIIIRPREPNRVMIGYRGNLEATMQVFRNLWFHTNDEGYFDEQGELHFLGRVGESIRRRGVNISAEMIELEIRRHSAVLECAVVGVPSEFGEQEIQAFVNWVQAPPDEHAAFSELSAFLLDRMPRQYVPRYFAAVASLPKTNTGKTQKRLLRPFDAGRWDREAPAR